MDVQGVTPRLAPGNFYGEMLRQHDAGGFSFSETRYRPGSTLPFHSHESHFFCFILSGTYREAYERRFRSCQPAMILYHPAGELHAQYFDQAAVQLFRVEVKQARMRDLFFKDLSLECRDFQRGHAIGLAHKLYQEFREPDALSYLAIEGLTLELIAAIARDAQLRENKVRQPPRWLRQAHELIKSRYLEHLMLDDIAGIVCVHPVTLAREFRLYFGCTIGEMVRRERVAFACSKLLNPDESLAEIAIASGFCDQSHLARVFKKITGVTPSEYRASHRPH